MGIFSCPGTTDQPVPKPPLSVNGTLLGTLSSMAGPRGIKTEMWDALIDIWMTQDWKKKSIAGKR